jgi:biopolymer transport protein ExbB/TolQ
MNLDLIRIWAGMGTLVRIVVIVLTLQGIASLTVAVDRLLLVFLARRRSRAFAIAAKPLLDARKHSELSALAKRMGGHLAVLMARGLDTYDKHKLRGERHDKAVELSRRALERRHEELGTELNRGLSILASTGSTAPFVGLLGTVLGIINAFHAIAESGSGGLGTIGAAIGEALVVTGYGLIIAIPTVLLFNWLSGRVSQYEMGLQNAAGELIDHLEGQEIAEAELHFDASATAAAATSAPPVGAMAQHPKHATASSVS